jgi:hypothetical protein
MKCIALLHLPLFLAVILAFTHTSYAQVLAGPGVTDASSSQSMSNRTFSFSGTLPGQLDGALSVTFSIYPDQQSGSALWTETQIVQVTGEKYSVMLGSTSTTGLPPDIFSADQAHWLGVQVNGSEKRFLLVSVPYAMKAVEAERLGGLLPSDYVTVQQLQSALQSAAVLGTPTQPKATSTGPTGQAAAAGTPPQPATDFTDNNGTEVLLVTQQGPGYAIHAISNLQPAIYAENNALIGTALQVVETSTDGGASTGLFAQTLGSGSIAGVFDSAGPAILELRKSGTRMVFFDQFGDMTANGEVRASEFAGSGSGLTNIPNSATTATASNLSNSIVSRDFNGSFSAGTVQAGNFIGSGFGLTDIPPTAINATPNNMSNSVVARDGTGSFAGNQISANIFFGSGSGLLNIPPTAINATPNNVSNSVVARDGTGSFGGNQISANIFFGSGSGLLNIPPTAINATPNNVSDSVVARDGTGSFGGNQISANIFFGSGAGLLNVPPTAINATPLTINNSIVARDGTGSFNANQIFANTFFGSGGGLTNIPPTAINATSLLIPNTVVARDADGNFSAGSISGSSANFSGAATPTNSVLAVNDTGNQGISFSVNSANNPAALFMSSGPTVFMAGRVTGATTVLSSNGDLTLNGTATAHAFSGDGSALTNVSSTKIGTLSQADIATVAALNAETASRQAADTAIQASVAAETSARQSDVSSLQTSINSVSAANAKLAASNTFTAGTQDFSSAAATLPVQAVLNANTPAACVASKELLIKTDAPAGQQLFICNSTANGWILIGGSANGVLSFNGRNGSVSPATGDYSFAQISGSAAAGQLPSTVVYNNLSNTFTGNQTVNGAVTATSFSGSGSALTGVNAATLNGLASGSFAQLGAANTFSAKQTLAASTTASASLNVPAGSAPATPAAGDVWNTGSTLQYRDSASTTRSLVSTTQSGGLQLLKLTASISPANVGSQACSEQSFTVSGISTGDVLLSVLQPSTSSPGANIAIGGFRVSAANTVAVQFCNVSRNNGSPTAGVYTFALMR